MNYHEPNTVNRLRKVVAWFTMMSKSNDMSKGGDVASDEEFTVPLLCPMKRLILVRLNEALRTGDRRLKTVLTTTRPDTAFHTTVTGRSYINIIFRGKERVVDFGEVWSKLSEEDRRLLPS